MTSELLVCPGCRRRTPERLDVRTIARAGDLYVCTCGRRYPIVDGVPIVLADPDAFVRDAITSIVERDLPIEVVEQLVEGGPDDAPYAQLHEHLSIYLDAHWGDRAEPPPDHDGFGARALVDKIAALPRCSLAVELGCSAGRIVAELAARADHAVGIDLHFGALRRARKLLAGERVTYGRRIVGRHYAAATASGIARGNVTLACGDAHDPPLIAGMYDRVVALNMLDSVAQPRTLLAVVDGLCAPGGEIILASPYAWESHVMAEADRFGGRDPAAALRAHFAAYAIEDEAELPWALRRDARSAATYCIHYLRLRKG